MACLLVLAAVSCGEEEAPTAVDPEGAFTFSLLEQPRQRVQLDRRVAWHLPSGVRVTAQRLAASDSLVRERSVEAVAEAIALRYSLGEVEGDMSAAPCRTNAGAARCLAGWISLPEAEGGARYEKRGVVVRAREEIVVLEVAGPDTEAVEEQAQMLERTLVVGEG